MNMIEAFLSADPAAVEVAELAKTNTESNKMIHRHLVVAPMLPCCAKTPQATRDKTVGEVLVVD